MSSSPHTFSRSTSMPRIGRLASLPAFLTIVVVVTGLARLAAVFERLSPRYLPDEFLYSQLARSIGKADGITILGQPAPFPALLEPLATAPFWLSGDAEVAYRLTQSLHAAFMATAAIPIYLLSRRLGLSSRSAVIAVALSAVAPGLIYVGYVTADALGYLLALTAIWLGVRSIESSTRWSQVWFLVAAAGAISARSQYVVLIPAFLVAAIMVDRGRVLRTIRRLPIVAGTVMAAGLGALAAGPSLLGRYEALTTFGLSLDALRWTALSFFLLTIGTGVVIVPGAAAWLGSTIVRPGNRTQTAFAWLVSGFAVSLLVASAVVSVETRSERFFERYLIALVPLLVIAFLCWLENRAKGRWIATGIGLAMIALAALVPLSTYAEGQGHADSPTLLAVTRLSELMDIGSASLAVAAVITGASIVCVLTSISPLVPRVAVVGTAFVCLTALSIGAHAGDIVSSQRFEESNFVDNPRWVDATGARNVLLVQTAHSGNVAALVTSFWNTSVTGISRLGDRSIDPVDGMGSPSRVTTHGVLVGADGSPIERPILFASSGTAAAFSNTVKIVPDRTFALVLPDRAVRLIGLAEGVRSDGTLAPKGRIAAYPGPAGRCSTVDVRVSVPGNEPTTTIRLREGGTTRTVRIRPGDTRTISVTSRATTGRSVTYDGWLGDATAGPTFVTTIALARFAATTSICRKG